MYMPTISDTQLAVQALAAACGIAALLDRH